MTQWSRKTSTRWYHDIDITILIWYWYHDTNVSISWYRYIKSDVICHISKQSFKQHEDFETSRYLESEVKREMVLRLKSPVRSSLVLLDAKLELFWHSNDKTMKQMFDNKVEIMSIKKQLLDVLEVRTVAPCWTFDFQKGHICILFLLFFFFSFMWAFPPQMKPNMLSSTCIVSPHTCHTSVSLHSV